MPYLLKAWEIKSKKYAATVSALHLDSSGSHMTAVLNNAPIRDKAHI